MAVSYNEKEKPIGIVIQRGEVSVPNTDSYNIWWSFHDIVTINNTAAI